MRASPTNSISAAAANSSRMTQFELNDRFAFADGKKSGGIGEPGDPPVPPAAGDSF